jgi:hypothetical protein
MELNFWTPYPSYMGAIKNIRKSKLPSEFVDWPVMGLNKLKEWERNGRLSSITCYRHSLAVVSLADNVRYTIFWQKVT